MAGYTKLTNLEVTGDLKVSGTVDLPLATADKAGAVKQGVAVADAASTAPTAAEFKALLDSLRAAGIIATS
ncbi:MAG: hypothetical protein IKP17_03875 [Oscillospiraceae bacterium]|nr:hypothetical protein [Oscillospiraceae bacterium]MBR4691877.1 hypothetical protein [Oscillospiraceae bacterium]